MAFLSHRRRETYRPPRRNARAHERFRHGHQRRETARVVGDARSREARAAALDGDVELLPEHRVEVGAQHHRVVTARAHPASDIAHFFDRDVAQAGVPEQRRQVRAARALSARGRGNGRQRRLADQRPFVGALDVVARGAHSVVGHDGVDRLGEGHRHEATALLHRPATGRLTWTCARATLNPMEERDLIYDWNRANGGAAFDWTRARVDLNDETLRDGLQSPSVTDPPLEDKKRLWHLMAELGMVAADIGLPGAGPRVVEQVRALAKEIRDAKLPIAPNCAARTVTSDVEPIVRISDELGIKIEAATFIGSSPIRQYAEDWTLDRIVKASTEAVTYAVQHGLPVMYVTEDTTRARPETLKTLYGAAIDCGATPLCLAANVGQATADGLKAVVHFR